MDCGEAREAISTLLDDEPLGDARDALAAHLATCAACLRWRDGAHEVTRRLRLVPAKAVPPPAAGLLAAASIGARRRRVPRAITLTRVALVAVALAQLLWVTLPALVLGTDHAAPIHVSHEMGSFDMALAVGFLVAAWMPARAQGMRALVGAAALLLVVTALIDLAGGRTTFSDEAPHLLAVAGWLFLRQLAALMPAGADDRAVALRALLRRRTRGAWSAAGDGALRAQVGTTDGPDFDGMAGAGAADALDRAHDRDHRQALAGSSGARMPGPESR
jgi:predicted anti-sigma-YlaC factor YlaD